jgi:hypothetical protein
MDPWTQRALALRWSAELELAMKGYSEPLIRAGLDRAWGASEYRVSALSSELLTRAFYETFLSELRGVERWIRDEVRGLTA